MLDIRYGPVELYLVNVVDGRLHDGVVVDGRLHDGVVAALGELLENGTVQLLDLVVIEKSATGSVTVMEIEDHPEAFGIGNVDLMARGIAGVEDINDLAELIAPGAMAALVALELSWARKLADQMSESRSEVLAVERIPAPVVNALMDAVVKED